MHEELMIRQRVESEEVKSQAQMDVDACKNALGVLSHNLQTVRSQVDLVVLKHFSESNSYERLEFMKSTMNLLQEYVTEQLVGENWIVMPDIWCYMLLIRNITTQIDEISRMIDDLLAGRFTITVNFDIFELSLRKYYEEVIALFPLICKSVNSVGPETIIRDRDARECWLSHFGNHLRVVDYGTFITQIVRPLWDKGIVTERFEAHLAHFFNFPRDNFFSIYRFNVLVTLFGPFPMVAENFNKYVLCPGFLGLINMIKAEELLTQLCPQLHRNTVLMRFSRRKPELLAFTSLNIRTGTIEHRRNVNSMGQPIPIGQYLAKVFPGYDLILMGVDDMVTRCENTFTFAHGCLPYIYSAYP